MEKTLDLSEHIPKFPEVKESTVKVCHLTEKKAIQCFHLVHCTTVQCVHLFHDREKLPP